MAEHTFGSFLRELRIRNKETLRSFCLTNNLDVGNHSKLERSQLNPPCSAEVVEFYAEAVHASEDETEILNKYAHEFHLTKLRQDFRMVNL